MACHRSTSPSSARGCAASLVFGVRTHDPSVCGAVAARPTAVALAAAYLPARRATRINPLDALRR